MLQGPMMTIDTLSLVLSHSAPGGELAMGGEGGRRMDVGCVTGPEGWVNGIGAEAGGRATFGGGARSREVLSGEGTYGVLEGGGTK
jgi:hypothetical protein